MLENLEIIPEAFDYLQLPYQIVKGSVGRLEAQASLATKLFVFRTAGLQNRYLMRLKM